METVNAYLFASFERHADRVMQVQREKTWTYGEAARAAHGVARALQDLGVAPGDRVAIVAENSPRWFHVYAGCLAAGAVVVPRGEDISDDELRYILDHSEAKVVFAGTAGTAGRLPAGRPAFRLDADDECPPPADLAPDTLARFAAAREPADLAVILYTSGTTGKPKGVMLEHRNLAHNIRELPPLVDMQAGDLWVSILPSWHTFEQTIELCGYSLGCVTVYSDPRRLREDLKKHRPQFFASVPRVWETIYEGARSAIEKRGGLTRALFEAAYRGTRRWRRGNPLGLPLHLLGRALFYGKVAAATGGRLKCAVSGGGAIAHHVDEFFVDVGIPLLIGYGLTETAPVVAIRRPERNIVGTIGCALPDTELRISPAGTLLVRGPQVMRGYYKEPELTSAVLDEAGWFDTGDLMRITDAGDLVFLGRAKETIVLSGGENVEPEPIEVRILESPLVAQVMLVGQDRKTLGALIVPEAGATDEAIRAELRTRTGKAGGFRSFEAVHHFVRVDEPFSLENGLITRKLSMRRNVIAERYRDAIEGMY